MTSDASKWMEIAFFMIVGDTGIHPLKVAIVGTGNVAIVLGRLVAEAGHAVVGVYGRDIAKAAGLAERLGSRACDSFDLRDADADLCIVAVSDAALKTCGTWLQTGGMLTVHTAGSVPMSALEGSGSRIGVLYPLQTLNAHSDAMPDIPFLVDGSSQETVERIIAFAKTLSATVQRADDEERIEIHLAAVIGSNLMNHLLSLTEEYCRSHGIQMGILRPLLRETLDRAFRMSPSKVQTGPAARNDIATLRLHLDRLGSMPDLHEVYLLLSRQILSRHGHRRDSV